MRRDVPGLGEPWHAGTKPRTLVRRPADLQDVDGAEAVWLWTLWKRRSDRAVRERLLRYCSADVLGLRMVTSTLLRARDVTVDAPDPVALWILLESW